MIIYQKFAFTKLLTTCRRLISKYRDKEKYPQYAMFDTRFNRMMDELFQLKDAYLSGKLATDFKALEITNMLDRNDPEEIIEAVLELNKFYLQQLKGQKGE